MKIRYDFFKEVMQGKYNKYYILNTTNVWNDLPSYQNSVSGAYLYGDFFFFYNINSKAKNWAMAGVQDH